MRAAGRRAAAGDFRALAAMKEFLDQGDRIMWLAAAALRSRGAPLAELGDLLGMTKESVWERLQRQDDLTADRRQGGW